MDEAGMRASGREGCTAGVEGGMSNGRRGGDVQRASRGGCTTGVEGRMNNGRGGRMNNGR
eukprot:353399-Chlamydomonas_euryale.AAC.3